MLYTDLNELKALLDIDPEDNGENKKLNFLIRMASSWIEEIINRPSMSLDTRTEYYNGTGTQKLLLKSRPVYQVPMVQVFVDDSGYYGSTSGAFTGTDSQLTYGKDFCLQIDQPDGRSRCGILLRINAFWNKQNSRVTGLLSPFLSSSFGSIKVVYTAGYTVDDLPNDFRLACNLLVTRLWNVFPMGMEVGSENYEDKSLNYITEKKDYLTSIVKPMLYQYRNWTFGGGN